MNKFAIKFCYQIFCYNFLMQIIQYDKFAVKIKGFRKFAIQIKKN